MSAVDFEAWAIPNLEITLGGRTFTVRPPSVEDARVLLAAAVKGEVALGLVAGQVPAEVQRVLDTIGPDDHPALGDTFAELAEAGIDPVTIDRVGYYAVFYWARGREYADALAEVLWTPRDGQDAAGGGVRPKARRRSRRRSGQPTG